MIPKVPKEVDYYWSVEAGSGNTAQNKGVLDVLKQIVPWFAQADKWSQMHLR